MNSKKWEIRNVRNEKSEIRDVGTAKWELKKKKEEMSIEKKRETFEMKNEG
mgnify:FL=1